ncbi:MAG: hypothetical protein ACTSQ4_07735 [Candidatus Heimdallarchaeaceae archaeon]
MKNVFKKILILVMIFSVIGSFAHVQTKEDGEYYSSKFKEGSVLSWESNYRTLEP